MYGRGAGRMGGLLNILESDWSDGKLVECMGEGLVGWRLVEYIGE